MGSIKWISEDQEDELVEMVIGWANSVTFLIWIETVGESNEELVDVLREWAEGDVSEDSNDESEDDASEDSNDE